MNPVTERFLYLEWLDNVAIWTFFGACVVSLALWILAKRYKHKLIVKADGVMEFLLLLGGISYLTWRFFFAWKGIYYP